MIYVGWDSEYLAVIGLPLFIFFVESGGFHFANHAVYLPRLPNTMVVELGRCKLRAD
jgi:hypothetical protein